MENRSVLVVERLKVKGCMREFWGGTTVMYFDCVDGDSAGVKTQNYTPKYKNGFCLYKLKRVFRRFSSVLGIF